MREIYGVCGAMSRRSLEAEGHSVMIEGTATIRGIRHGVGQLNGHDGLGKMSGTQIEFSDPLLNCQRSEDESTTVSIGASGAQKNG